MRGKMGITQASESFSARFLWQQQGPRFAVDLWGPLGQGRVRMVGDPDRLELREGDGSLVSEGPPEQVMVRHLGWSLPLSVLPEWVRGRPAPGLPVSGRVYDEAGRLSAFKQLNWQVELERYQQVDGVRTAAPGELAPPAGAPAGPAMLPYRITASRDHYRVRLAVSEWQI